MLESAMSVVHIYVCIYVHLLVDVGCDKTRYILTNRRITYVRIGESLCIQNKF